MILNLISFVCGYITYFLLSLSLKWKNYNTFYKKICIIPCLSHMFNLFFRSEKKFPPPKIVKQLGFPNSQISKLHS